ATSEPNHRHFSGRLRSHGGGNVNKRLDLGRAVTRRRVLTVLRAGGVAVTAAACGSGSKRATKFVGSTTTSTPTTTSPTTPSTAGATTTLPVPTTGPAATCTLTPEMTEGPYYISGEAVRSAITEGRPGTPLLLALTV